jgi:transposase
MSRYRLYPTPAQEAVLRQHCSDARYVWNLAWNLYQCGTLETYGKASRRVDRDGNEYIHQKRRPVRKLPTFVDQCRMLTEARAENKWLADGSQMVQQQALRDFDQAMRYFFAGTNGRPQRRKKYLDEGFRITGRVGRDWGVRRLNRRWGAVQVRKIGWVRFRWSRAVPACKSYRVNLDRAGRWHVAFAAIPEPLAGPGTGEVVGIDCGVAVSLTLSTGETHQAPASSGRTVRLRRRLDLAKRASNRRGQARKRFACAKARDADRRKDWAEKASTDIARRFDLIRVEDLQIGNMTRSAKGTLEKPGKNVPQKAGLNREILAQGWGLFARRLGQKAPRRIEKVNPAFTSRRCSACGHVDPKSRKSQADFRCTACGYALNADVNAARNIAAGHAVTARGGFGVTRPLNREPQAA